MALLLASPLYFGGLLVINARLRRASTRLSMTTVELRENRNLLQAILDNLPAQVAIRTRCDRFVLANTQWLRFHGVDDVVGRRAADLNPTGPAIADPSPEVIEGGAVVSREASIDVDGRTIWYLEIEFPVPDEAGALTHAGCIRFDITDEKRIQNDLFAAKQAAEASDNAKTTFLANMSHELRTPLNAIIGFSEVIGKEMLAPLGHPRYREYLDDIGCSGRHLVAVIGQILDFAKVESGHWCLELETCAASELAGDALRMTAPLAAARHQDIGLEDCANGVMIEVDPRAIRQMLLNLLSNAVKHSPEGDRIVLDIRPLADGGIQFSVTDHGKGISQTDMIKVLQPFSQVGEAAHPKDGIGLGLAITRSLAELHGGELTLESRLGEGTTARVVLPARRVAETSYRMPMVAGASV